MSHLTVVPDLHPDEPERPLTVVPDPPRPPHAPDIEELLTECVAAYSLGRQLFGGGGLR